MCMSKNMEVGGGGGGREREGGEVGGEVGSANFLPCQHCCQGLLVAVERSLHPFVPTLAPLQLNLCCHFSAEILLSFFC